MRTLKTFATVVALSAALLTAGCGAGDKLATNNPTTSGSPSSGGGAGGTVHIASQNFGEAAVMAQIYKQLLEAKGYTADVKLTSDRSGYMPDFEKGNIDVVPEYVGGILDELNREANGDNAKSITTPDANASIQAGQSLLQGAGITLLNPSAATDTNAFFVTKDYASSNNLTKLSDLSGKSVVLAAAPDCKGRSDCELGLTQDYGIKVTKLLGLGYASDSTYQSVIKGESQLGETSTTDGTLDSQGLQLLDDDKHIQPAQNLVPAVNSKFLAAHADLTQTLNALMAAMTTQKLTELNAKVAVDREDPVQVAKDFLTQAGLI